MRRPSFPCRPAWFARPAARLLFQYRITSAGFTVRAVRPPKYLRGGFALTVDIRHPDLPDQRVTIAFGPGAPEIPRVYSDGPSQSPHRYSDGSLCMWHPADPREQRWDRRDSPLVLMGLILAHLMREEWWRRTGEWAGAEAEHAPIPARATEAA